MHNKDKFIKQVDILVLTLCKPAIVAIYENDVLVQELSNENPASDFLIEAIDYILKNYDLKSIVYANGPGSFMGIKVAYVILKTLSITRNLPLYAVSGFELNGNSPIKANKNLSFVLKDNGEIILKKVEAKEFKIPSNLSKLNKTNDILPNYIIDAV